MTTRWSDLRIEAGSQELAILKAELAKAMDPLKITEDTAISSGKNNEPIITAIVIALGGATLTKEVFQTIRHWMDHRERMENIRLSFETDTHSKVANLDDVAAACNEVEARGG